MSNFITADKQRYAREVAADLRAHHGARAFYSRAMVNDAMRRVRVDQYFACWMYALFCSSGEYAEIGACSQLAWGYDELRSQMADILHALDEQRRGPPSEQFWWFMGAFAVVMFFVFAFLVLRG